ncbi:zinc knuckle [Cooperia oncophora]
MRRHSLCLNCGAPDHRANECNKGACRICDQFGHHTSICRQTTSNEKGPVPVTEKKTPGRSSKPTTCRTARQNFVSSSPRQKEYTSPLPEQDDEEESDLDDVLCLKSTSLKTNRNDCVLIGEALVFNGATQSLETVHILLDTGADRSFICEELARRLRLENEDSIRMSINTFGNHAPGETLCDAHYNPKI